MSNIVLPTDNSRRKGQGESDQVFDQSKSENDPLISKGERQPTSHKGKTSFLSKGNENPSQATREGVEASNRSYTLYYRKT